MAKRRWASVKIEDRFFEVDTKNTAEYPTYPLYGAQTVDDCYDRPSAVKRAIFDDWCRFFHNHDGHCSVSSYNSTMFTLVGVLTYEGVTYRAQITKSHNILVPIA